MKHRKRIVSSNLMFDKYDRTISILFKINYHYRKVSDIVYKNIMFRIMGLYLGFHRLLLKAISLNLRFGSLAVP